MVSQNYILSNVNDYRQILHRSSGTGILMSCFEWQTESLASRQVQDDSPEDREVRHCLVTPFGDSLACASQKVGGHPSSSPVLHGIYWSNFSRFYRCIGLLYMYTINISQCSTIGIWSQHCQGQLSHFKFLTRQIFRIKSILSANTRLEGW